MTTFGWDASNYDDPIRQRDGIDFYTHKAGEGLYVYQDREYGQSLSNARNLGIPILGGYFVNHPGDQAAQADWFVQLVDAATPWWREHPCFIWQIDAEKFDYMVRAPTMWEIAAFGDRLVNAHGIDPRKVLAYAPQWLYGNSLVGLGYRLWASAYGGNPYAHYLDAYPGDDDGKRWQDYSGQVPMILQYGSNTTIGDQTTCDANAYRGTLAELLGELGAGAIDDEGDDMNLQLRVITDGDRKDAVILLAGTTWFHVPNPPALAAVRRLWPNIGELQPLDSVDLPACGVEVPFPAILGGQGPDAAAIAKALADNEQFTAALRELVETTVTSALVDGTVFDQLADKILHRLRLIQAPAGE